MRPLLGLSLMATVAFATPHASLPFAFEKNAGQTQDSVRYFGRTPGAELWLTDSGAVLAVDQKDRRAVLRMTIAGARPHPQIEGSAQLAGYANYFTGNDESRWRTHVPLFERVRYHDTYPGIDLVFHGQAQTLEYDWVVAPGADPRAIRMSFRGANEMRIDATGDLVLEISGFEIRQKRPHIYQAGREIGGRFSRRGHAIGFEVDSDDPSQALTIDPVLSYASYLGIGRQRQWLRHCNRPQRIPFVGGKYEFTCLSNQERTLRLFSQQQWICFHRQIRPKGFR